MYPLSKQETFVSNLDRIRAVSPEVATAFRGLREAIDAAGPLDAKERELVLLAGFAATRNEGGFRVHCTRLAQAGAGLAEVEHVVLMMLGTSLGLATAVDALRWAHEELADGTI